MPLIQDLITQKDCCSRQGWTYTDGFKDFLHPQYSHLSQEKLLGDLSNYISRILIGPNSWFITLLFLHTKDWLALAEGERGFLTFEHTTLPLLVKQFHSLEQHPILAHTVLSCLQVCRAGEPSEPLLALDTTSFQILSSMGQRPNSCNTELFTKHFPWLGRGRDSCLALCMLSHRVINVGTSGTIIPLPLLTYVLKSSFPFYNYWWDPRVHLHLQPEDKACQKL